MSEKKQEIFKLNRCKICGTIANTPRKYPGGWFVSCEMGHHYAMRRTLSATVNAWNKFFVKRKTDLELPDDLPEESEFWFMVGRLLGGECP